MKHMKIMKLALLIGALVLGNLMITTAQAEPIASAESVVTFSNFGIYWEGEWVPSTGPDNPGYFLPGAQVTVDDIDLVSYSSTQQVKVSIPGQDDGASDTKIDSASFYVETDVGSVPGSIPTSITATTLFPQVTLPLDADFAVAETNEDGAPIIGLTSPSLATLHSASYASLSTVPGAASANTDSSLSSEIIFTPEQDGRFVFQFDIDAYLGVFLSKSAEGNAQASWSFGFNLYNVAGEGVNTVYTPIQLFGLTTVTGTISDPALGEGAFIRINPAFDDVGFYTALLETDKKYSLSANLTTTVDVARVSTIPEPATLSLLGLGLLGLGLVYRKSK